MDRMFTIEKCDRCKGSLDEGRIRSMFNEEIICMDCKQEEQKDSNNDKAVETEYEQVKMGNYNFKGIGR